jgi:type IV pilus assembly protein PilO
MNINNIVSSLKKVNLRDKKTQGFVVVMLIGAAIGFGWYKYMFEPLSTQIQALQKEKTEKQNKLNTLVAMKPQMERIRAEIQAKRILLDSLKSIFPDEKEVPKLIHDITRLANASDVHTVRFSPMADVKQEYYIENRYQITMWAGYHEFASFLSRLANLRLIINLGDVKLMANPQMQSELKEIAETGAAPVRSVEATFTLTTFSSRK